MSTQDKILLVEDEENFGNVLKSYLEMNGYEVDWAVDGHKGWNLAIQNYYDLCIMDVMMPFKDGFTLAKEIKIKKPELPLVFLTAKNLKEDQLKGFKLGADDYLTKPIDSELLLYKIKAILGRVQAKKTLPQVLNIGQFRFEVKSRILSLDGDDKKLSPKESQLLGLLSQHQNQVMPRSLALLQIWKNDDYFTKRSMDVYIAKLRKYLVLDPNISLENVHGEGYRLMVKSDSVQSDF